MCGELLLGTSFIGSSVPATSITPALNEPSISDVPNLMHSPEAGLGSALLKKFAVPTKPPGPKNGSSENSQMFTVPSELGADGASGAVSSFFPPPTSSSLELAAEQAVSADIN